VRFLVALVARPWQAAPTMTNPTNTRATALNLRSIVEAVDNTVACDECDGSGEVLDEVDCLNPLRGEHFTRTVRSTCRHCDGLGHVAAPELDDDEGAALAGAPVWAMDDEAVAMFAAAEGGL
jgi:hypothetical protein